MLNQTMTASPDNASLSASLAPIPANESYVKVLEDRIEKLEKLLGIDYACSQLMPATCYTGRQPTIPDAIHEKFPRYLYIGSDNGVHESEWDGSMRIATSDILTVLLKRAGVELMPQELCHG